MTCVLCEKPVHARQWCGMHYVRWLRTGDPLRKRRNRGVLDAPVIYPLGPAQLQIVRTLAENPGRIFPWWALGSSRSGFENALVKVRRRFGSDEVLACSKPQGYLMEPQVARKLMGK